MTLELWMLLAILVVLAAMGFWVRWLWLDLKNMELTLWKAVTALEAYGKTKAMGGQITVNITADTTQIDAALEDVAARARRTSEAVEAALAVAKDRG